jgi:CRISPR-associated protein Cas2
MMPRQGEPVLSAYRFMWLLVMFDLPVGTRTQRREATKFRNWLLDEGYEMSQWSIYLRTCVAKEQVDRRIAAIAAARPTGGKVHVLTVTDRQMAHMAVFRGRKREKGPKVADQLVLF